MAPVIRLSRIKVWRVGETTFAASATAHLGKYRRVVSTRGTSGVHAARRLYEEAHIAFDLDDDPAFMGLSN